MLKNPYAGSAAAETWGFGLANGFVNPNYSLKPPHLGITREKPSLNFFPWEAKRIRSKDFY